MWSSGLLILAGLLTGLPILFRPDMTQSGFALRASWAPVNLLLGIGAVIGTAGLIVLYRAMSSKISAFGHLAFVLTILGSILSAGMLLFVEAAIVPVLSSDPAYTPLLAMSGPLMAGSFGVLAMLSSVILAVGFLLLGIYLISSSTVSFVNGLLFIIGAPLLAFAPPLPPVIGVVGGLILGIALVWIGISIRNGIAHESLAPGLRLEDECVVHAGGHA